MYNKPIIVVLTITLVLSASQWYQSQQKATLLEQQLERMEAHAQELEKQVVQMQAQLNELEGRGLESILEEANGSVVLGWDTLILNLQNQLGEFGNLIKEEIEGQLGTDKNSNEPEQSEGTKPSQKHI